MKEIKWRKKASTNHLRIHKQKFIEWFPFISHATSLSLLLLLWLCVSSPFSLREASRQPWWTYFQANERTDEDEWAMVLLNKQLPHFPSSSLTRSLTYSFNRCCCCFKKKIFHFLIFSASFLHKSSIFFSSRSLFKFSIKPFFLFLLVY